MNTRFNRQLMMFGSEGQAALRRARVAVVGVGGLGSIVAPQLALLGVGAITLVDGEELELSNRNRHLCARSVDPIPGSAKVDIADRMIVGIDPTIVVEKVRASVVSAEGFAAIRRVQYVMGCVDREGVRLVLTELCAADGRVYIDAASDVMPGERPTFGGRVCCALAGHGCLVCMGVLDLRETREDLETCGERLDREAIYGVPTAALDRSGPSVVSLNGVVASLAVTEFMKLCTGIAEPARLLNYDGRSGKVTVSRDEPTAGCYFCTGVWGSGAGADVDRYLRSAVSGPAAA